MLHGMKFLKCKKGQHVILAYSWLLHEDIMCHYGSPLFPVVVSVQLKFGQRMNAYNAYDHGWGTGGGITILTTCSYNQTYKCFLIVLFQLLRS